MSERKILLRISLTLFLAAIACGFTFAISGYSLLLMLITAVCVVGAFMSFALSFAAEG